MDDSVEILIVEDEVIVAMELQDRLEDLGYDVLDAVTRGEDAIERAADLHPTLILMDIMLDGELDGIEAAQRIRAEHEIPVVFLTAYSDDSTLERAKEVAPFGYIVKPFEERELYATVEVALNQHRMEQRLQEQRDDLLQILNGLRQGTAMTDADGQIVFLSAAARRLLSLDDDAIGQAWIEAFPFDDATMQSLREASAAPPDDRSPVPARVEPEPGSHYRMEIEIQNDPRNPDRRVFVFYDVTEVHDLRRMLDQEAQFHDIIGKSEPMQRVFQQIRQTAQVDSTALISGKTGTGKELVARAIHDAGARSEGPFVPVNCAALSEDLAASQLFGHAKGAFTGAVSSHTGFFEAADGGTLFLDEIGDIPLDVQRQLLRVLEERAITRLGETKSRPVDVRIVAATHRDLRDEVDAGRFREDLLYRIRIARIELPPLRQRRADIPLLVRAFLQECRAVTGKEVDAVSQDAMRRMIDYDWPGNVRELRNAIEYALIQAEGALLQPDDLPPELHASAPTDPANWPDDEAERIRAALEHTGGNRKEAAKLLDISRATLYRRLDEHDIS